MTKDYSKTPTVSDQPHEISRTFCCNHFARRRCLMPCQKNCWFCRYAWFDASRKALPEKGQCRYPVRQTN